MPVVATGRYVEIASERDDPVCGGTAAHMDRVIEAVYAVIGETPPDRRFVRFEWLELDEEDPLIGGGRASFADEGVLIRSDVYLVQEHELVHAVQMEAWPMPNDFLFEGYAVLLDGKRNSRDAIAWPSSASLDELVEAPKIAPEDYDLAWFVVSQVALDHGFDGLRDFWHAVPRGSTAAEVRAAYEGLFGRPLDALVEPYWVGEPGAPGSYEAERQACDFALCAASEVTDWIDDQWSARGPTGCEDDPDAVGPDARFYGEWGEVWRDYAFPGEPSFYATDVAAKTSYSLGECGLVCENVATGISNSLEGPFATDPVYRNWGSPMRVEVRGALADLPNAEPGGISLSRTHEPPN